MALTVIHSPTKYDFSRNPNYVEISTDNLTYTYDAGEPSIFYFANLVNAAINDQLNIQFGVTLINYVFKATTNLSASPKELAINTSLTSVEYITELANTLFTDTALSNFIEVFAYESALFLKAKLPGPTYDLIYSNTNVTGAGTSYTAPTTNMVTVNRPNYKIISELQVYESSAWATVVKSEQSPSNNKVRFDLQKYIDAYLEYDFPTISSFPLGFQATKSCKKFRVKISEAYGSPAVEVSTSLTGMTTSGLDGFKHVSVEYKVLKAGFDKTSSKIIKDTQFNYYATDELFLTRQPRTKKISRKQAEFLYWLFQSAPASNACVRTRYYHTDGTTTITYNLHTSPGLQVYDVWSFPVYYAQSFNQPHTHMDVCVWDVTSNQSISEVFTYIFDDEFHPEETFLYFMNSDAGCDTSRLFGTKEFKIDFSRESFKRTSIISDTSLDGDEEVSAIEKTNVFTVFSGWKTKQELLYIEELFMSKKVVTTVNPYGDPIPIPVVIISEDLVAHKTNENLKGYVVKFREAVSSEISQAQYISII